MVNINHFGNVTESTLFIPYTYKFAALTLSQLGTNAGGGNKENSI